MLKISTSIYNLHSEAIFSNIFIYNLPKMQDNLRKPHL